jgi:hypothetical protein
MDTQSPSVVRPLWPPHDWAGPRTPAGALSSARLLTSLDSKHPVRRTGGSRLRVSEAPATREERCAAAGSSPRSPYTRRSYHAPIERACPSRPEPASRLMRVMRVMRVMRACPSRPLPAFAVCVRAFSVHDSSSRFCSSPAGREGWLGVLQRLEAPPRPAGWRPTAPRPPPPDMYSSSKAA